MGEDLLHIDANNCMKPGELWNFIGGRKMWSYDPCRDNHIHVGIMWLFDSRKNIGGYLNEEKFKIFSEKDILCLWYWLFYPKKEICDY